MPDYKHMYMHLFNAITRSIHILQDGQINAEEVYIKSKEKVIRLSDAASETEQDKTAEAVNQTIDENLIDNENK